MSETENKIEANVKSIESSTNNQPIPIIVWADIESAPLGQSSKLLEDLAGKPVLRRTMERICKSKNSGQKIIFAKPDQTEKIKSILAGLPVKILAVDVKLPGWWPAIQSTRKWSLSRWRGGLLGACAFDEDLLLHLLAPIAQELKATAIMTISAHSVWVDPDIIDNQIEHYLANSTQTEFNFTQAPPGIAGFIMSLNFLFKLPKQTKIAGSLINYSPNNPEPDPITKLCSTPINPALAKTGIRFTCDTKRSLAMARKIAESVDPLNANSDEIMTAAKTIASPELMRYPEEIEIELCSGWPWPKGYRPTPTNPRSAINPDLIIKRISELTAHCDDLIVNIAGFGEPTKHPQFETIINEIKSAGAFGISVQSSGLFDETTAELLAKLPIDAVSILIDVPDQQRYANIMGTDEYQQVLANISLVQKALQNQNQATPLLIPEMIKTYETMELMDEFYDSWRRQVGWATIKGFSNYARQIPDHAVNSMAGPTRRPCKQIFRRMTILANGDAAICDQDFENKSQAGSLENQSIAEIWQGQKLSALREAHLKGEVTTIQNDLCKNCEQWHRV